MASRIPPFDHLLIDLVDGRARASQIVDWAVDALVAGFDTPALRVLAGQSRSALVTSAIGDLRETLSELGFEMPDDDTVRRTYLKWLSSQFVDGALDSAEVLRLAHSRVVSPLEHPPELMPWCYLWEGLHPETFSELRGEDLDNELRRQAELYLHETETRP